MGKETRKKKKGTSNSDAPLQRDSKNWSASISHDLPASPRSSVNTQQSSTERSQQTLPPSATALSQSQSMWKMGTVRIKKTSFNSPILPAGFQSCTRPHCLSPFWKMCREWVTQKSEIGSLISALMAAISGICHKSTCWEQECPRH